MLASAPGGNLRARRARGRAERCARAHATGIYRRNWLGKKASVSFRQNSQTTNEARGKTANWFFISGGLSPSPRLPPSPTANDTAALIPLKLVHCTREIVQQTADQQSNGNETIEYGVVSRYQSEHGCLLRWFSYQIFEADVGLLAVLFAQNVYQTL